MSKLTFVYGTMTSGKTTALLQEAHNFRLHGLNAHLLTAAGDTRSGSGVIRSRIGISAEADVFTPSDDLGQRLANLHARTPIDAVFCDEAQFLSRDQVWQLSDLVDDLGIQVSCFGLRSDFRGSLFEGSATLMALADVLTENTGVCASGAKAMMVARLGPDGRAMIDGPQVMVGGEETYVAVSRASWKERIRASMLEPAHVKMA